MPPTPTPASHFHTLIYPGTPSSPPQTKSSPASHLPQDDHTIVSAGLSSDGRIFTGRRLKMQIGGAPAEAPRLKHEVAVVDKGRAVLGPSGRCRQVWIDCWPGIMVVLQRARIEEGEGRCWGLES
ncbi:hypothetical protein GX48_07499 [Paracoccidioides brasiliensis]|nr:hypothetical protein GX48_07499 [Paracoccidioides brasiliensis]